MKFIEEKVSVIVCKGLCRCKILIVERPKRNRLEVSEIWYYRRMLKIKWII